MGKQIYTEPTPEMRADWVRQMIGESGHWDSGGEFETSICDLLADIKHFCHVNNIDFEDALRRANNHFYEELEEHDQRQKSILNEQIQTGQKNKCDTNAPNADTLNQEP